EAWHLTLPLAVTLKRFLAPLLDLSLGIWLPWFWPSSAARTGRVSTIRKHASRHGMPRRAAPSRDLIGSVWAELQGIPATAIPNGARAPSPSAGLRTAAPIRPCRCSPRP